MTARDDEGWTLRILNVLAFAFVLALALMVFGAVFRDDGTQRQAPAQGDP